MTAGLEPVERWSEVITEWERREVFEDNINGHEF